MKIIYALLLVLSAAATGAQTILNAYAKVTGISGGNVLSVSNVNQANHTFAVGEKVIVMQVQDDVIGANTNNNSNFGDLSAIGSAGLFEVAVVSALNPASGVPTAITLSTSLVNTYNTGANASVQILTFRNLGANYTTTANISGLAWDGNVGGAIAFEVGNTLTLNHRISADGLGFRGGAPSADADEPCDNSVYITSSNLKSYKGEGIYKNTNANFTNGRGKILNGGGGGSQNNAGGGGGGNYTAGGGGGLGYQCNSGNSGLGLGGIALSSVISSTRIFMGGGAGGGQENNTVGTAGGNGGGIILILAGTIATSNSCGSSISISANGITPPNSGNDGSGGGGAAGSILIQAISYAATPACPLAVTANGGAGGTVGNSADHGGGGGGAQGVVIYSTAQPTVNVTTSTLNGAGGGSDSNGNLFASGAAGTDNSGIVAGPVTVLPIELMSFDATPDNGRIKLSWSTASEKNNSSFTVEKSADATSFTAIGSLKGAGNSSSRNSYQLYDQQPLPGINYYRLKQTDFNGQVKYVAIATANVDREINFSVFPNPIEKDEAITIVLDKASQGTSLELSITDLTGKELFRQLIEQADQKAYQLNAAGFFIEKGIYLLRVKSGYSTQVKKLIIK